VPSVVLSVVLVASLVESRPWVVPDVEEVGSLVAVVEPLTESPLVLVPLVVVPEVVGAPVESPELLVALEVEPPVESVLGSPSAEQAAIITARPAIHEQEVPKLL